MVRKLRRKFVLITMGILFVVFAVIITGLNLYFAQMGRRQNFRFLRDMAAAERGPHISPRPPKELPPEAAASYEKDSFSLSLSPVYLVRAGNNMEIISIQNAYGKENADDESLIPVILKTLRQKNSYGTTGSFRYYKEKKEAETLLVMMDMSDSVEREASLRLLTASLAIGLFSLFIFFLVSLFLSRYVTKPAEDALNKQKQFISDASHELKTPLSIISINTDILSGEIGENKYINYIQAETKRMGGLVRQLLLLARMEEPENFLMLKTFDLSEALLQMILPFESTAYERNISYHWEIPESCCYTGEKESIKQVAAILLDNAFKYTPDQGEIRIGLKAHSSKITIEVFNTGEGILEKDLPHIFERFYRSDPSRSKGCGSYGLGLAIARSIIEAHGGKIKAESRPGEWVRFLVQLS